MVGRRKSSTAWKFFKGDELTRGTIVWAVFGKFPKWPCVVSSISKDAVRVVWLPYDYSQTSGYKAKLVDRFTDNNAKAHTSDDLSKKDAALFVKGVQQAAHLLQIDQEKRLDAWAKGVSEKKEITLGLPTLGGAELDSSDVSSPSDAEEEVIEVTPPAIVKKRKKKGGRPKKRARSPTPISDEKSGSGKGGRPKKRARSPTPISEETSESGKGGRPKKRAQSPTPVSDEKSERGSVVDIGEHSAKDFIEQSENKDSEESPPSEDVVETPDSPKIVAIKQEPAACSTPKGTPTKAPKIISPKAKKVDTPKKKMTVKLKSPKMALDAKAKSNEKFKKHVHDKITAKRTSEDTIEEEIRIISTKKEQDAIYAKLGLSGKLNTCKPLQPVKPGSEIIIAKEGGSWKPVPKRKPAEVEESKVVDTLAGGTWKPVSRREKIGTKSEEQSQTKEPEADMEVMNKPVLSIAEQGEDNECLADSPASPSPVPDTNEDTSINQEQLNLDVDDIIDQIDGVQQRDELKLDDVSPASSYQPEFPSLEQIRLSGGASPAKKLPARYEKGDIVWAKYRKQPFWPSIVTGFIPKSKTVVYEFLPLRHNFNDNKRGSAQKFKSPARSVFPFMEYYDTHSFGTDDPQFAVALAQGKDICNELIDPFTSPIRRKEKQEIAQEPAKEEKGVKKGRAEKKRTNEEKKEVKRKAEDPKAEKEARPPKKRAKKLKQVKVDTGNGADVEEDLKPENDDSEEDAVSDAEETAPKASNSAALAQSQADKELNKKREQRMKNNEELLNFIMKNPLCKAHLLNIYSGAVESSLHNQWRNRDGGLMVRYSFGPICDEKQIDALFDVLSSWYTMVPLADIRVSMIWTYVGCVWIPEAVKFALMHTRGLSVEEAECILRQPPGYFDEEMERERNDLLLNRRDSTAEDMNITIENEDSGNDEYDMNQLNSSHLELLAEAAAAMQQEDMQPSTSHK